MTITIPRTSDSEAVLSTGNREVKLLLPFSAEGAEGTVLKDGISAFSNENGSTSVPVAHADGSLQVFTVIDNAAAPTRYDYELSVPKNGTLDIREDGVVLITGDDGSLIGGIAPAWAKDASGAPVPTWYEVSGQKLTQIVEHRQTDHYPIVADPWLGITLFTGFKRDTYQGDYRYSAWVTGPGAVILGGGGGVGGYLAGQAVFRGAGWDEWKAKWPAITNKATLQQQYNCHVAASSYGLPFTQDYNLERFRANRPNWTSGITSHRCNW